MKKWIFSLSLLIATSLASSEAPSEMMIEHDHKVAIRSFQPSEPGFLHPDSVPTSHLTVRGMQIDGFDADSQAKMDKAFEVLEEVVNSEEFKSRVLNFKNVQGLREFASNKGLTNEQIYAIFMEGRETLQPNTPNEMNFYLSLYYKSWSKVIGYTSPDINTININWKFFRNYLPNEVAGNLAHEWTHKIGFDHKSAAEHDSAPYAIGYIVEEMAGKLLR